MNALLLSYSRYIVANYTLTKVTNCPYCQCCGCDNRGYPQMFIFNVVQPRVAPEVLRKGK